MEKLLRNIWPGATEDQPVAAYDHAHSWPSLLQQQRSSLKYSRTVPIKVHTTPTERILLAGPFKCWPGSWVATILLVPEFERQAKVIGFTGDAVDEKQQPLPFPPLHMHHIHVAGGEYTHLWETHGDYNIVSTSDAAGHRTAGYTSRVSSPSFVAPRRRGEAGGVTLSRGRGEVLLDARHTLRSSAKPASSAPRGR